MKVFQKYEPLVFDHEDDMQKIILYLGARGKLYIPYKKLEQLYYEFSNEVASAGWLIPDDHWLAEFVEWLSEYEL